MKKTYWIISLSILLGTVFTLFTIHRVGAFSFFNEDIWRTLFKVEWQKKYNAEFKIKVDAPRFTPEIKALDKKEITISGYVVPVEMYGSDDYVILSAYPANQCFFCGGAGPESVMEVYPLYTKKRFAGERVTLKGRLELNENDHNHLIYILRDAVQVFGK
ncbi:MAG: hypothetical protein NW226_07220 [Microscillaceae bacterium]|nr:hypothetical protein [Microscillaceae bacterium]